MVRRWVFLLGPDPTDQGSGAPNVRLLGALDPTREVNRKVPKEEMAARVSQIYSGREQIKKCPKAYSLSRCNTRKFHHNKILLATWFSFIF
jgi:hypothetical protein